jgi:hypothetical protein
MTTQRVFQLRRNALRNDAVKRQGSVASVIRNVPVPICTPWISHGAPWDRTRASAAAATHVHIIHACTPFFNL